jgi:hypothetical protein
VIGCILFDKITFYIKLLHIQGNRLFESLHFRNVLQEVQRRFCADSKSEKSDPKLPSGRPSVSTVQDSIRSNVSATRPDAL